MTGESGPLQQTLRSDLDRFCYPVCPCRSRVYTADLESALHYLLRVELAAHTVLQGEELKVFKDFVTLVAKVTASAIRVCGEMAHKIPGVL